MEYAHSSAVYNTIDSKWSMKECAFCGKRGWIPNSTIYRSGSRVFCSYTCYRDFSAGRKKPEEDFSPDILPVELRTPRACAIRMRRCKQKILEKRSLCRHQDTGAHRDQLDYWEDQFDAAKAAYLKLTGRRNL